MSQIPYKSAIIATRAVRHYGLLVNPRYDASKDVGQEYSWDWKEGYYLVKKINWFINYVRPS